MSKKRTRKERNKTVEIIWWVITVVAIIVNLALDFTERGLILAILLAIFGGIMSVCAYIQYSINDEIRDSVKIEQDHDVSAELTKLMHLQNGDIVIQKTKRVLTDLGKLYTPQKDVKSSHFMDFVHDCSAQRLDESIRFFNKMTEGPLTFVGPGIIRKSTSLCYRKADEIFAISWPDLKFWRHKGKAFLEEQKRLIESKRITIERFFIVRTDRDEDLEAIDINKKMPDLIDVLYDQIESGIIVYFGIDETLEIPYTHIKDKNSNPRMIPDFSIFNDEISSTWIEHLYPTYRSEGDKIVRDIEFDKDVIIDCKGIYFEDAKMLKDYLSDFRKTHALIDTDPGQARNMAKKMIKDGTLKENIRKRVNEILALN